MEKLQESKNYEMFELLDFNRDVKKTKRLEASMKEYGFRGSTPLEVIRGGNGKLKIRQGHHRFYVARKLGIPVKYVVMEDDISIYQIESTVVSWNMRDYLESHCRAGLPEYLKIREYCDETGISVGHAVAMLGGNSAGTSNFSEKFKTGSYIINTQSQHANIVKEIILYMKKCNIEFYNTSSLVAAVSKVVFVKDFNPSHMKTKIKNFSGFISKKANVDQYLTMLEDIYNRQSREKIPLKFLADAISKERHLKLFKKN